MKGHSENFVVKTTPDILEYFSDKQEGHLMPFIQRQLKFVL